MHHFRRESAGAPARNAIDWLEPRPEGTGSGRLRSSTISGALAVCVFALPAGITAQVLTALPVAPIAATNSPGGQPLSERVVAYGIDAKIDSVNKTLDATENLTYRNLTGQPLNTFPFHLYLNAFRPQSTFTSETHFSGGIRDNESEASYDREKLGSITISQISADGFGDLTASLRFTAPDDGNMEDHTVAEVTLPRALAPGESITFHLIFHDKFPLSIARNGYKRDFIMGGQWFPKVGVFWHGSWNCHQYHSTTEFFADFGTFDVSLTLPKNYVVGASGVPTGNRVNADATQTLSFHGEDIHDFAWAASPHFKATNGTFLSALGPVQIHVLALATHPKAGERYLSIVQKTMAQFEQRYGPYPYKIITVIDPEPGSEMDGMEYPTLITGGTSWYEPTHITEITAEHEFGHQYWYGMVATNEFEDAWLDEGINSYTEVKVLAAILGKYTSAFDRPYANAGDFELERGEYIANADFDPVTRFAWKFRNSGSYAGVTYGKTATLLATLEGIVGTPTMDEAMRTYFTRYRFTHPTTQDFLRTIEEVAIKNGRATGIVSNSVPVDLCAARPSRDLWTGCPTLPAAPFVVDSSLRPYLNQAVYGTQTVDYAIDSITSSPVQWWLPEPSDPKKVQYLSTVYLHRKGDFTLPITVEIVFSDGTRLREHWDGGVSDQERWTKFTYTRNAKVISAEIDPDQIVLLDTDFFNNSYTVAANPDPARKLTNIWLSAQQLVAQLAAWFV